MHLLPWNLGLFNSCEAIAAIIGDIVGFYNSKNWNCNRALSLFTHFLFTRFHDY